MGKPVPYRILLISSDSGWQRAVEGAVAELGTLRAVASLKEGLRLVRASPQPQEVYSLVIIDSTTEPDVAKGILNLRELSRDIRVVVASAAPTWRLAREVLDAGAVDFIVRHDEQEPLRALLEGALHARPPATSKLEESDRGNSHEQGNDSYRRE